MYFSTTTNVCAHRSYSDNYGYLGDNSSETVACACGPGEYFTTQSGDQPCKRGGNLVPAPSDPALPYVQADSTPSLTIPSSLSSPTSRPKPPPNTPPPSSRHEPAPPPTSTSVHRRRKHIGSRGDPCEVGDPNCRCFLDWDCNDNGCLIIGKGPYVKCRKQVCECANNLGGNAPRTTKG